MEFEYSPQHSAGTSLHLLSPTHGHHPYIESFPSIRQLRRSLSRSPSKPARFPFHTKQPESSSPTSPASPSALARTHNADGGGDLNIKPRYSIKRTTTARPSVRRTSPKSPLRRALSDNGNQINAHLPTMPSYRQYLEPGQENMVTDSSPPKALQEPRPDESVRFDFLKVRADKLLQPPADDQHATAKSSPLKRSDGVMNFEAASISSPRAKRRSLHGASAYGNDFNVFDQSGDVGTCSSSEQTEDRQRYKDNGVAFSSTWPTPAAKSPCRRSLSLRKSTIQQRSTPGRSRLFAELPQEAALNPALTRARSRISLDSALPLRTIDFESPFRRSTANEPPVLFPPPAQKMHQSAPKPHPLSNALSPSSSNSSMVEDHHPQQETVTNQSEFIKPELPRHQVTFSKSLPIGAMRPRPAEQTDSHESFATPAGLKMARPAPQAFMSTGLISKRNRNVEDQDSNFGASINMPDTPSKKAHLLVNGTPAPGTGLNKGGQALHEFGSPSTPFNGRFSKMSPDMFGKGVSIFGSHIKAPQLSRKASFGCMAGDDTNNSPTQRLDGQSNVDDLPPTPTKSSSSRPHSKGKSNSLRSSLFGRRASLGADTFSPPVGDDFDTQVDNHISILATASNRSTSPHTPLDAFTPPDPSGLSISAERRAPSFFSSSVTGIPATPTGPRDQSFCASKGQSVSSSGYFSNDVDTALTSRFGQATTIGVGEFSQVYRVEKPIGSQSAAASFSRSSSAGPVWAVKKTRRPYTGNKDRQRKMREVRILQALRGHEHIIAFFDEWEAKGHLYIQTEYCENGNLKDFLAQAGNKGRLDDFRIWKILLEICQGVKAVHDSSFIHLDLKPANVFIDWEGVLKIGDFGMASHWPAPRGLEGEGDREYIGPEVLSGRFDKPADVFALGMIMLEMAGNIVLPDNGKPWQRLRAGDLSDLPSLTWSSESSLVRNESGDPVEMMRGPSSDEPLCGSNNGGGAGGGGADELSFLRTSTPKQERRNELVDPPNFMIDPTDPEALEAAVQGMLCPDPDQRPTVDRLLMSGGVQWVERRRRAGATIYEGNWGPADEVLGQEDHDVEMSDM